MTVVINGTTGITSVNGSAAAPSVTGTDTDTGIVYGTNTLSMATGGTTALTANSAQGIQVLNTIGVGNTTPSASGAGITFPATQSASTDANTLDDYEEGTFTPAINLLGTVTYIARSGYYTKIGRQVTVIIELSGVTSTDTTQDGTTMSITGLPFSAAYSNFQAVIAERMSTGAGTIGIFVAASGTSLNVYRMNYNNNIANQTFYTSAARNSYVGSTLYMQIVSTYFTS